MSFTWFAVNDFRAFCSLWNMPYLHGVSFSESLYMVCDLARPNSIDIAASPHRWPPLPPHPPARLFVVWDVRHHRDISRLKTANRHRNGSLGVPFHGLEFRV